jgi:hypothetical protein
MAVETWKRGYWPTYLTSARQNTGRQASVGRGWDGSSGPAGQRGSQRRSLRRRRGRGPPRQLAPDVCAGRARTQRSTQLPHRPRSPRLIRQPPIRAPDTYLSYQSRYLRRHTVASGAGHWPIFSCSEGTEPTQIGRRRTRSGATRPLPQPCRPTRPPPCPYRSAPPPGPTQARQRSHDLHLTRAASGVPSGVATRESQRVVRAAPAHPLRAGGRAAART